MNCPACNVELKMTERQGVEIDYCPKCRGVWLDRGELDKIIDRSATDIVDTREEQYDDRNRYTDRSDYNSQPHRKHKKRESFLGNLFDFD